MREKGVDIIIERKKPFNYERRHKNNSYSKPNKGIKKIKTVSLKTSAPVCSKTKSLLIKNNIEVKVLKVFKYLVPNDAGIAKEVFRLAYPVIVSNLSRVLMSVFDVAWLLGEARTAALAATGMGGMVVGTIA